MFFSEAILSRRGPLAKVWLAAHMERKLSKTQTLQTDIEESVGAIMGQEVEIMALRLSGQLLLGVVRIYSRKAKYLLDDCNEALLKIKMAFRPGVVDMTEDQLTVTRNAITLQENNIDFELMLPNINFDLDFDERTLQPGGLHVARAADITLATADDMQLDLDGLDFGLEGIEGIGSQDYEMMDLGLTFDAPAEDADVSKPEDESMSVEVGRDAADARSARESLGSHLLGKDGQELDILSVRSRDASEHPFRDDMDLDFGGDLGGVDLDLGITFDETAFDTTIDASRPEEFARSPSRVSSRLSTPPPSPPPEDPNVTPKAAGEEAGDEGTAKKRKFLNKRQIIDAVTELEDGPGTNLGRGRNGIIGSQQPDVSGIVAKQNFLPRSRSVMRLLEIRQDPVAHFLPTKVTANGTYFFAGPPGLAPELADMFMRPVLNMLSSKRKESSPDRPNKKARLDKDGQTEEEDVEQARRAASLAPSIAMGSDVLRRGSVGPDFDQSGGLDFTGDTGAPLDDYQFEVDLNDGGLTNGLDRERSKSRMSTPAADGSGELFDETHETYADASCPIAMFDDRPSQSQSQQEAAEQDGKGYSRNTVKALSVIRRELAPVTAGESAAEKVISFRQMSHKASRRAASSFFFELLVLSTRDCVHVKQSGPFDNIEIRAKEKLWERQRHTSVAPSVAADA